MWFQQHRLSAGMCLLIALVVLNSPTVALAVTPDPELSPRPQRMAAREAWKIAESFANRPGYDVMIGSGGSMLPLYPDQTLLIVRRVPLAKLRSGMTVVFIGDSGRPVAHALVEKTSNGWLAQGLANSTADQTVVCSPNYVGAVIRAFTPVVGLASSATAGSNETSRDSQ